MLQKLVYRNRNQHRGTKAFRELTRTLKSFQRVALCGPIETVMAQCISSIRSVHVDKCTSEVLSSAFESAWSLSGLILHMLHAVTTALSCTKYLAAALKCNYFVPLYSILLASAARLTKLAAQTLHRGLETHAAVLSKIRAALLSNPRFRSSPASFTYPAAAALGLFSSWASSTSTSELHDAVSSSAYRSISTGSTGGGGGRGGGHCAILLSARDIAAARKIVNLAFSLDPVEDKAHPRSASAAVVSLAITTNTASTATPSQETTTLPHALTGGSQAHHSSQAAAGDNHGDEDDIGAAVSIQVSRKPAAVAKVEKPSVQSTTASKHRQAKNDSASKTNAASMTRQQLAAGSSLASASTPAPVPILLPTPVARPVLADEYSDSDDDEEDNDDVGTVSLKPEAAAVTPRTAQSEARQSTSTTPAGSQTKKNKKQGKQTQTHGSKKGVKTKREGDGGGDEAGMLRKKSKLNSVE